MSSLSANLRFLRAAPPAYLSRPKTRLQPIQAKEGKPNIDLEALSRMIDGVGVVEAPIPIKSPDHWRETVLGLGPETDAILPVSIACYPTEVWNSHPQPLVERKLPFLFWPIIAFDEPDFWRWSATDFLRALGVEVHLIPSNRHGKTLLRALAMRRFLKQSRMVVFGEQNFPWNANAAGHLVTESLGTQILVRPISDIRDRAKTFSDLEIQSLWRDRHNRYVEKEVRPDELAQALRTYLAIRSILEENQAMGFGVNCFGDLIINGGRDVPCLAQLLLREDGCIASCDGDYLAMMSMAMASYFLDKPCMMSNLYPVSYVGALKDHFGDPLFPDPARYPKEILHNLARLGHCGFVGVVSPEMDPAGRVTLRDWGGTYEIKRDGSGCGIDGNLARGEKITAIELKFDARTLLVAAGEVCETTRHPGMPHCESTALLYLRDLEGFVANISREHAVIVYGDHVEDFKILAEALGLECKIF